MATVTLRFLIKPWISLSKVLFCFLRYLTYKHLFLYTRFTHISFYRKHTEFFASYELDLSVYSRLILVLLPTTVALKHKLAILVDRHWQETTEVLREKPVPSQICPQEISRASWFGICGGWISTGTGFSLCPLAFRFSW